MKKTYFFLVSIILSVFVILSCKTVENAIPKSSQKEVTSLVLSGIANATSVFDQATGTYTFTVPTGTNIKALALTFSLPTGAKSSPASGSTQDFTNPVTFTITAEDGTSTKYTVKINVQTASKSSAKQILTFSFAELNPVVQATINNATFEVTAAIPATANIKSLKPTITVSDRATISPLSGVSQDFTNPVKYIVTAEDGTMQVFMVKVVQTLISNTEDIYVAGYEYIRGEFINSAKYWKNNVPVSLNEGSEANSIVVNGNDVYVAGFGLHSSGNRVAKYWKNGVAINLTDGKNSSTAKSIVINGNDIYVVGNESNSSGKNVIKYWKNGIAVNLSDGKYNGYANSIAVNGNDIHVLGAEIISYDSNQNAIIKSQYWKNGVVVPLPPKNSYNSAYASEIIANGKDIYVAGFEWEGVGGTIYPDRTLARYWKNGIVVELLDSYKLDYNYGRQASSIAVDGNDVYVAGYIHNHAVYWKNGVNTFLYDPNFDDHSSAYSIKVKGNDVFVAGFDSDRIGGGVYWKNNVKTFLKQVESSSVTHATSIFVK